MPAISMLIPGNGTYLTWKATVLGSDIPYGLFIGDVLNFIIVAFALFIFIVKFLGLIMRTKKQEAAAPPPPPAPTKDQELLTEIRDLLRAK
jgi:large conductance mechanosensitive channel